MDIAAAVIIGILGVAVIAFRFTIGARMIRQNRAEGRAWWKTPSTMRRGQSQLSWFRNEGRNKSS